MNLSSDGFIATVPPGWDVRVARPPGEPPGSTTSPFLHAANFPLPARRGNFGGEAVDRMGPGDVFVALVEYGADSAEQPLFAHRGLVRRLDAGQFRTGTMPRAARGLVGTQAFFTEHGRPFCLYAALGSAADPDLVELVNRFLAGLVIVPTPRGPGG